MIAIDQQVMDNERECEVFDLLTELAQAVYWH